MYVDPIVQEVRDAGEKLAKEANYDLHTFFRHLREKEKKQGAHVVSRECPDMCQSV